MSATPEPGMPVVVVLRAPQPIQWQGELVAIREASLAIRVTKAPEEWDSTLPYFVICGTPGSRFKAPVSFVARNGAVAAFKVQSRWQALDLRREQRFVTDMTAEVRSVLGNSRQPGRIIDISLGGAAIATETKPGGSQIEVGINAQGYSARVHCDVISTSQSGTETVLHLRFKDLTPPHQAFIRQLVGWLVESDAMAS
jgi:hypothetical protein